MEHKFWLCLALCVSAGGSAGCTELAPWERGNLAKPQMALDPNPIRNAERDHVFEARQAAKSGASATGGGCGCR